LGTNIAAQKKYGSLSPKEKAQNLKNDTAAHKEQQESLTPNKKGQIFNEDADAHRKQHKTFSPEEKAQISKNNAAAQCKHCKSLSPEQKSQNLKIMLLHIKIYESLPLNKKARLIDANAAQHHVLLIEKEKKNYPTD
jgi:hypothetical protein